MPSLQLGGLGSAALEAAFDAGVPIVEATGTHSPPWYTTAPTVFYRIVTDRNALHSPTTKFVVIGQRPPDTFGVWPGSFDHPGVAGPVSATDPRGVDQNADWKFINSPLACAADNCAGVAYFSFTR